MYRKYIQAVEPLDDFVLLIDFVLEVVCCWT